MGYKPIAEDLLAAMDIAVMERLSADDFHLAGTLPDWITEFLDPDDLLPMANFRPGRAFPFLESFLGDAERFWAINQRGRLKSGPWIEEDRFGMEVPLEATAVRLGSKRILMIEWLGAHYEEKRSLLQEARENRLFLEGLIRGLREQKTRMQLREDTVVRLAWALESHTGETEAHLRRIGLYAESLAESLGWDRTQSEEIRVAAAMHDIGMFGTSNRTALGGERRFRQESVGMREHTGLGAALLGGTDLPMLQMARDIALSHHEKWDGSGYPQGLEGDAIPESARIVAVANAYDTLAYTTFRAGAEAEQRVIAEMTAGKDRSFDPRVSRCLLAVLPRFRRIRQTWADPPIRRRAFKKSSSTGEHGD